MVKALKVSDNDIVNDSDGDNSINDCNSSINNLHTSSFSK